jgi:hypothetical protein
VLQRGSNAASVILFWVWGSRHQRVAGNDLSGMTDGPINGYRALRTKLLNAGLAFVRIKWCWGQWFAMWVVVPSLSSEDLIELQRELREQCLLIRALWKHRRYGHWGPEIIVEKS